MNNDGSMFAGLRVLDCAMLVAGPFTAALLGDFGADVIKVEMPGVGDPLRKMNPTKNGAPIWWKVTGRNKRCITLNLKTPEGQDLLKRLVRESDVLIEAFQPGTMEGWNLGYETLKAINPRLIMLRVSGFGQTGPYRSRPGFGRIAEAMSGAVFIIGYPDQAPVHPGFPLGDYVAGLTGAFAVSGALAHRERTGVGQCIDLALYESLFRLLEFNVIEYDQLNWLRQREGNRNSYTAPVNTYPTADGEWASITASTQAVAARLFEAIGRPELIDDPRFESVIARVANNDALDEIIGAWLARHTLAEVQATFERHDVPFSPIMNAPAILKDPHFEAREAIVTVDDPELGPVRMQGVFPKLSATPGRVRWAGPRLGEHNGEVFGALLGMREEEIADLVRKGVI